MILGVPWIVSGDQNVRFMGPSSDGTYDDFFETLIPITVSKEELHVMREETA